MSVAVPAVEDVFQPLFSGETEDVILARWQDWANEGLDPATEGDVWVDTREGGHWATVNMPAIREFARVYDLAGTDVAMSAFVTWSWEVYLDDLAAQFGVERDPASPAQGVVTFEGAAGSVIDVGSVVGVEPSTPDGPAPTFRVTEAGTIPVEGSIDLAVAAVDAGAAGDVAAGAITAPITPLTGVTSFSNAAPTVGGQDVETDDSLRAKTLDAVLGKGPGAVRDYVRWAGDWPGVGRVWVKPVWDGASTVLVMIADPAGLPLPDAVVTALQQDLDPDPGTGSGTAPVGAHVTVRTPAPLVIDIDLSAAFGTGFSWDGAGLTTAVGPKVTEAWQSYLLSLRPGDSVSYDRMRGIFATAAGVGDIATFTVNGGAVDVALTTSETAQLGAVTVS